MDAQTNELNPELVALIAAFTSRSPEQLAPSTHIVFDLGVDGGDVEDLVNEIEARFEFVASKSEWLSVACLGELNSLVARLRGVKRAEVLHERELRGVAARGQFRRAVVVFLSWATLGVVSNLANRRVFLLWVVASLLILGFLFSRSVVSSVIARRRWKRERLGRYGV